MALLNRFILVSTAVLAVFLVGIHNYLTTFEENGCNMTYLFEYAQFVKISLPPNVSLQYKRYGLYAFGEGRSIEVVRSMKFNGIPVLFIPGSRGSHKQVRSLASVSFRKTLGSKTPFHFDYFAVDFNDDQSGFYGGVLDDETKFVRICIEKIISLYKMSKSPESVILVGHSMGGMVAKGLFLDPDFNAERVKIILTLATPHSPALLPDHLLAQYYERVDTLWDSHPPFRKQLTVISIGGGPRDVIVKSSLTITKHANINVLTSDVSDVWLSVDHYCILWCKELVLVLVRTLFDCVDVSTKQITNDINLRKDVFSYHLLNRSAGKKFLSGRHPDMILWNGTNDEAQWLPLLMERWSWSGQIKKPTYVMISLATAQDTLFVEAINHKTQDWVFACKKYLTFNNGLKACKNGENLSSQGRIDPSFNGKRKHVKLNLSNLRMEGYTHIVIRSHPSGDVVKLSFDLYKEKDRLVSGNAHYYMPSSVTRVEEKGALIWSLEISSLQRTMQSFIVNVESPDCNLDHLSSAHIIVPWAHQGSRAVISGQGGSFPVIIHTPKPPGKTVKDVRVDFFLEPECTYNIWLEKSLLRGLGSIVGTCGTGIFSSVAVVLLMSLAVQLVSIQEEGNCPILHSVLPTAARPYYILPAFSITSSIARALVALAPWLPSADVESENGLMDALFIPLFLHCSALALTYLIGVAVLVLIIFYGQALNNIVLKFINKFVFGLSWVSESLIGWISKVPVIASAFLIALSFTSAGLSLSVGLVLYFIKLISLYEDFWQEIIYWPVRVLKAKLFKSKKDQNKSDNDKDEELDVLKFEIPPTTDISFHFTLMLLWGMLTIVTLPSLLTWAKNYRYSTKLEPDPFFYHGLIMAACAGILWQSSVPKTNLLGGKELGRAVYACSVLVMVYGRVSVYRLAGILVGVTGAIAVHQGLGSFLGLNPLMPSLSDDKNEDEVGLSNFNRQDEKMVFANSPDQIFSDDSPTHLSEDKSLGSSDCSSALSICSTEEEEEVREKNGGTKEQEDDKTTSTDLSTSSFENISIKELKE